MNKRSQLHKVGILFVIILIFYIVYAFAGSFFITNETGTNRWSNGTFYNTTTTSDGENVTLNITDVYVNCISSVTGHYSVTDNGNTCTVTFQPNATYGKDTILYDGKTNYNYGSQVESIIGSYSNDYNHRRLAIWFNLSVIPSTANITFARFRLYVRLNDYSKSEQFDMYPLTQSWVEGTKNNDACSTGATWNTYDCSNNWPGGAGAGNDIGSLVGNGSSVADGNWMNVYLNTTAVERLINGTDTYEGFLFWDRGTSGSNIIRVNTSDAGSSRPKLEITYQKLTNNVYYSTGAYESEIFDAGQNVSWDNLSWDEYEPNANVNISFQVRSCDDASCSGETFVGPDNSSSTYFTSSPATLNATITPNNQYFQYKAFFKTNDTSVTPHLEWVNVSYSLLAPTVTIVAPSNNSRHNITDVDVNYTLTGNTAQACWYSNDSGATNNTITCGQNLTSINWDEGSNTVYIYANDSSGNVGYDSVTFIVDTVSPTWTITTPKTDNSSIYNSDFNLSAKVTDSEGVFLTNITITNSSGSVFYNNFTDNLNSTTVYVNDSINASTYADGIYTIEFLAKDLHTNFNWNPKVNITKGTDYINFNFGKNDNIKISIQNIVKSETALDSSKIKEFSTLKAKDRYNFRLGFTEKTKQFEIKIEAKKINAIKSSKYKGHLIINDNYWFDTEPLQSSIKEIGKGYIVLIVDNKDSSISELKSLGGLNTAVEYVKFEVDTTPPSLSIVHPSNNQNFSYKDVDVNYTVSDTNLQACWYSNDSGATNHTITCGQNLTSINWDEGSNTVYIYANDSLGNENSTSVTFTVDTTPPTLSIVYPTNTTYNTNVSELNYTVSDSGVGAQSCWYSIDNGATNSSSVTAGTNFTNVQSSEGSNTWTLYCNDTLNNLNSTSVTFTVDTTPPTFTNIQNHTHLVNTSFSYDIDATDSGVGVDCFSVNDTTNWQINCSGYLENITALDELETIWLNVSVNDTLNNLNSAVFKIEVVGDNDYPIFSNYTENPANNTVYSSGATYEFNVTVTSTNGTVILSFNGTNYTATNLTSTMYNVTLTDLAGGTYSYYWASYGNGTNANYNSSSTRSYTIAKATSSGTLYLNHTINNMTIQVNTTIAINGTLDVGTGRIQLYVNGTLWNNGTSPLYNLTQFNSIDYMPVTLNYSGNSNYTSFGKILYVNVTADIYPPLVTINSPTPSTSTPGTIVFNVTLNEAGYCEYSLDLGATNITMETSDNLTFYNSSSLTEGTYTSNFYCNDTSGNTNYTESVTFTLTTPSGGGGGGGVITIKINDSIICEEVYYFIIQHLSKDGNKNYTKDDLIELNEKINSKLKGARISVPRTENYIINYTEICENLTNLKIPKPFSFAVTPFIYGETPACNPDINKTLFWGALSLDWYIPIRDFVVKRRCDELDFQKYFFKFAPTFSKNIYVWKGIKIYPFVILGLLIGFILIIKSIQKVGHGIELMGRGIRGVIR